MPSSPPAPSVADPAETLALHLANTPLAVIEWDRGFRVIRWSGQSEAIFGWPAADVLGKHPNDWRFVHDDDRVRIAGVMDRLIAATEPRSVVLNRNYHRSGQVLSCEWHNSVLYDADGQVRSVLSLVLDLTARVAAEADAARRRDQLHTALRYAGMAEWEYDLAAGTLAHHGPAGPDVGRVHPADAPAVEAAFRAAAATGGEVRVEFRGPEPAADGGDRWFAARGRVVGGADGTPARVVGVTADVTDRKRADAKQAVLDRERDDSRRLESLGLLAGGLAHDFNNLLTVIIGNAGMLRLKVGPDVPAAEHLATIDDACLRAADLCRQLTAYAGLGRMVTHRTDVAALLAEELPALRAVAGGLAVEIDAAAGLPLVRVDPFQLRQAVLNLIANAAEATVGGDPIRVTVGVTDLADTAAYTPVIPPGRYVAVAVTDAGPGIPADVLGKVFEPFFSTKFAGRGLGLAAVRGIARGHHGAVRIETADGHGTTVRMLFPADAG